MENVFSSPTSMNVTFSGNSAPNGGGMNNTNSSPWSRNVTFGGNSATNGGAIYNEAGSHPNFTNATLSGNSASGNGGGIYNDASIPVFKDSILWGNTPSNDQIHNINDGALTASYSDIQGGFTGTGNLNADPLLGVLGTYGGNTQVLPLLPGSAAIDTGDNATCAATDQRGVSRPQRASCDMGAFESQGFSLAIISGDEQSTLINTAFAQPLAVEVSSNHGEPVDGGKVSFTPPASGASAVLSSNPVSISGGAVSVTASANGSAGPYVVTADGAGIDLISFYLTNLAWFKLFLPLIFR
jgi:predicted outer membrane repeat protein